MAKSGRNLCQRNFSTGTEITIKAKEGWHYMKDKKKWIAWFMIITLLIGMNTGIQPGFADSSALIYTTSQLTTAQDFQSINIEVENDTFTSSIAYQIDFGTTGLTPDDISSVDRVSDTEFVMYIDKRPLSGTIQVTIPAGGLVQQNSDISNTLYINVLEYVEEGDFLFCNGSVVGYTGSDSNVVIPNTINGQAVTRIGQRAFDQLYLSSIVIPDTVTRIDDFAFASCEFKSVDLPSGLLYLGRYAFNANRLNELTLPSGISVIREGAFNNNSFRTLSIPNTVKRIEKYAFRYSTNLQDVTLPEGLEYIGKEAFLGCSVLQSLTIPASVTEFGYSAFENCQRLRTIYFLGNAPSQSAQAFNGSSPEIKIYVTIGTTGFEGILHETYDPTEVHEVDFSNTSGMGAVPGLISGTIGSKRIVPEGSYLINPGYRLVVWNTSEDGKGISYRPGDVITIGNSNVTLHAMWLPVYSLSASPHISHGSITIKSNDVSVNNAIEDERIRITVMPDAGYRVSERSVYYSLNGVDTAITSRDSEYDYSFTMPGGNTVVSAYFEPDNSDFGACNVGGRWSVTWYYGTNKDVVIPSIVNGTKALDLYDALFYYNEDVTSVSIDEGYTVLSEDFLNEASKLVSLYLPDSLTTLEYLAIGNNAVIDRIRIPKSVTSIVKNNFSNCNNLSTLIFEGNAPTLEDAAGDFLEGTQNDLIVYHKTGATGFNANPWTNFTLQTYDYMLKYHHNGAIKGLAPTEVMLQSSSSATIQGNTGNLVKPGYTFNGWNTKANGTGTHYAVDATISASNMTDDVVLFAEWLSNNPNIGGTTPETPDPAPTPTTTPSAGSTTPAQGSGNGVSETVKPTVKIDEKGKAVATVTDKQIEASIAYVEKQNQVQNFVIKVDPMAGATSIEADLSIKALKALADSTLKGLTFESQIASLSFDAQAIKGIANVSEGNLKIAASKVDRTSLSSAAQTKIADHPVYEFSVTSGDKLISEFGGSITVKLPYVPSKDEDLNAIVIYYLKPDGTVELVSNCRYDETSGTVQFDTNHFSMYAVGYHKVTFSDVKENDWYQTAVAFLASREIVTGKDKLLFKPLDKVTRGEFITMILKAYGIKPNASITDNFVDAGDHYYTGYLAVAKALGITNGIGKKLFAPERAINRQEMASMLYSSLKVLGQLPPSTKSISLDAFEDAKEVNVWAEEAMLTLVQAGVLNGNHSQLNPQSIASRAEVAQLIYNVLSK